MKGVTKSLPFRLGSICLDHYGAVKIDSLNSSCYVNHVLCIKVHGTCKKEQNPKQLLSAAWVNILPKNPYLAKRGFWKNLFC